MSRPFVFIAAFIVIAFGALPAHAVDFDCDLTLVGFDAKGTALIRNECKGRVQSLALVKVDLASAKETATIEIVPQDTPDADRQRVRAARWKEAEAKLKSEGFTIDPKNQKPLADDKIGLDGLVFERKMLTSYDDDGNMLGGGLQFTAKKGDKSAVIWPAEYVNSMDQSGWSAFYLSPDKRYLLLLEHSAEPRTHVFEVAKIFAALDAAPAAAPQVQPSPKK